MNTMRMGLFCALVGWMAADAQAQWGTYGSPDPIPLGQYAPRDSYVPAVASRTSYVTAADDSDLAPAPGPAARIPPPPSESSAVASMLSEPGHDGQPAPGCSVLPSGGYIKEAGKCDTCGDVCCGCGGCCSPWYASFDALYMTRSQPNKTYTSAEPRKPGEPGLFQRRQLDLGRTGHGRLSLRLLLRLGPGRHLLGPGRMQQRRRPGHPRSLRIADDLRLDQYPRHDRRRRHQRRPRRANNYTDNSPDHHIWRNWEAQDVEINFVRTLCGGECNRFGVDFIAGVRWFRFQDGFVFGAQRANDGTAYANDWLYLNDHITNDLVGVQAGFNASYRFADCWKVFVTPMFGVFDNHMTLDYNLYAVSHTTGTQYQGSSQTYANPNYPGACHGGRLRLPDPG